MIYGYCRISTSKQSIERQIRNIRAAYPDAEIRCEIYTGTEFQGRKELQKIVDRAKSGDIIVFDSVSRMSRNAEEGFALYQELYDKGVDLIFLKEPFVSTSTYRASIARFIEHTGNEIADKYIDATNEVLMILARRQIELAFEQAEKEVQDLRQRTKEGIETARLKGRQIGQRKGSKLHIKKKAEALKAIRKHSRSFEGTLSDREVMRLAGISKGTFYTYKKELMAAKND